MRITIVNHSDLRGGASIVSYRLMQALRHAGADARMLVVHKTCDDACVAVAGPHWRYKAAFMAEHIEILLRNGFSRQRLFLSSIATCGLPLHKHPWIKDADVVMLNWVNQGMLSLREIARIEAPVIWTMHDMWNMTGVCHYAETCTNFQGECHSCPMLHDKVPKAYAKDLSTSAQRRKAQLYGRKPMTFVAVSNWLAKNCAASAIMRNADVRVIPNAFPVEEFLCSEQKADAPRIVMGAARLDTPIKGLPLAIEALNSIADLNPTAVFFGALNNKNALDGLKVKHEWLGPINDRNKLREAYANAHIVLSAAHYENLPGTLIEGMAAGCVPVTFGEGGQGDIVDHLDTGYIARFPDANDLAAGLRWALTTDIDRSRLPLVMRERFSADAVARMYLSLAKELAR